MSDFIHLHIHSELKNDGSIVVEKTILIRVNSDLNGDLIISDDINSIGDGNYSLLGSLCGNSYGNITGVYIPITVNKSSFFWILQNDRCYYFKYYINYRI